MAYVIENGRIGTQPIADTSTVQNHPLGTIVVAKDPTYGQGEFIYLKGVTSTIVGDWVTYNLDDGTTTRLVANAVGPVGISMSANAASTSYGWYQISGKAIGGCLTAFADNGYVFITASPGRVDDTSVAGDLVNLAKGASTTVADSNLAEFEISRPFVNDNSNQA
jgi:hypothetical protein